MNIPKHNDRETPFMSCLALCHIPGVASVVDLWRYCRHMTALCVACVQCHVAETCAWRFPKCHFTAAKCLFACA